MTQNSNLQIISYQTLHGTHYTGKSPKWVFHQRSVHSAHKTPLKHIYSCHKELHTHLTFFGKKVAETWSGSSGCLIPSSPWLCLLGDVSQCNLETAPLRHNCFQENYVHELEIKENRDFIHLEKPAVTFLWLINDLLPLNSVWSAYTHTHTHIDINIDICKPLVL